MYRLSIFHGSGGAWAAKETLGIGGNAGALRGVIRERWSRPWMRIISAARTSAASTVNRSSPGMALSATRPLRTMVWLITFVCAGHAEQLHLGDLNLGCQRKERLQCRMTTESVMALRETTELSVRTNSEHASLAPASSSSRPQECTWIMALEYGIRSQNSAYEKPDSL